MPLPSRLALAVIAIVFGAFALGAEPPRFEADRSSLPQGARFRFASLHLRQPGSIRNSALSPDGKLLATASGRSVMIWDLKTGRPLRKLKTPDSNAYSTPGLMFSPDSALLGYVHNPESACVWSLTTGKEILGLHGKVKSCADGRFTPDGGQFVIADQNGIHVWNLTTGTSARLVPARARALSPDAKLYIQADEKAPTVLAGVEIGREIRSLKAATANNGIENGLAFSPDSKWLALVNINKAVELYDTATGDLVAGFPLPAKAFRTAEDRHPYYRVGLTRGAKMIFLATGDGSLHRWDVAAKKVLPSWKVHQGTVANIHHLWHDQTLFTTGADGLIRHWNLSTGESLLEPQGYAGPTHGAMSPDGRFALIGDARGRLDLWDATTGKRLRVLREKGPAVHKLAFHPASATVAVAQEDRLISLWRISSGPMGKTLTLPKTKGEHDFWVQAMRFSPDGRFLYVCSSYKPMRFDLATGKVETRGTSGDFAVSADGAVLATAYTDKLTLWDEMTGKVRISRQIRGENAYLGYPVPLAFSPDGRLLAAGTGEGHIVLFDAVSGSELKRFFAVAVRKSDLNALHSLAYQVTALQFSADSRWLISGGNDRYVRVWEVASGKQITQFDGHDDEVRDLAFKPDGRTAFSAASDGQSYLWDLRHPGPAKETGAMLWEALAADDARRAYRAVWALSEDPGAVMLLRAKIAPIPAPDPLKLRALIADLNSPVFRTRILAQEELAKYGDCAAGALREALKKPPSLETQRRLEKLLDDLKRDPTATDLREMRAVHVLEMSAAPEAQALLRHWAAGAPGARLTTDAQAALTRLARSSPR